MWEGVTLITDDVGEPASSGPTELSGTDSRSLDNLYHRQYSATPLLAPELTFLIDHATRCQGAVDLDTDRPVTVHDLESLVTVRSCPATLVKGSRRHEKYLHCWAT